MSRLNAQERATLRRLLWAAGCNRMMMPPGCPEQERWIDCWSYVSGTLIPEDKKSRAKRLVSKKPRRIAAAAKAAAGDAPPADA